MVVAETRIVNCGDDDAKVSDSRWMLNKEPMGFKDGVDVGMCVINIIKKEFKFFGLNNYKDRDAFNWEE